MQEPWPDSCRSSGPVFRCRRITYDSKIAEELRRRVLGRRGSAARLAAKRRAMFDKTWARGHDYLKPAAQFPELSGRSKGKCIVSRSSPESCGSADSIDGVDFRCASRRDNRRTNSQRVFQVEGRSSRSGRPGQAQMQSPFSRSPRLEAVERQHHPHIQWNAVASVPSPMAQR
jgi:hypothetical protein